LRCRLHGPFQRPEILGIQGLDLVLELLAHVQLVGGPELVLDFRDVGPGDAEQQRQARTVIVGFMGDPSEPSGRSWDWQ